MKCCNLYKGTDGMLWCFVIVEQNAPRLILFFQLKIFKYEPEAIVVLVSKLQLSSLSDVSNYNLQHYGFCAVKNKSKDSMSALSSYSSVQPAIAPRSTKCFYNWICIQDCQ